MGEAAGAGPWHSPAADAQGAGKHPLAFCSLTDSSGRPVLLSLITRAAYLTAVPIKINHLLASCSARGKAEPLAGRGLPR